MSALDARIQKILDDHVARGVVGVSLALGLPDKDIALYQSGMADKFMRTPMRGDHLFRIASCTKTFIATGLQGVTYKPNTWHHGLTVLDKPGRFAVFMWRVGGKGDEEFVPVEPFTILIP